MKNTACALGSLQRCSLGVLSLLLPAMATGVLPQTTQTAVASSFQNSPKTVLDEAWQLIYEEYVDGDFNRVDWLGVRQTLLSGEYTSADAAYRELRRVLSSLNDPYTRFLNPAQYSALTEQTSGEVSGVGIRLQKQGQELTITSVLDQSPADKAGIRPGDKVLIIDGRSSRNLTVEGASQLIRGDSGSQLSLTLRRLDDSEETLILTRELVFVSTVDSALYTDEDISVGYIHLDEFSGHAAEQMHEAINTLTEQGAEAFVLDLRGNPGGLLQASIEISRMWLPRGSIVRTVDRDGHDDEITANRTAVTDLPMAVLVDGRSASSSEIVTGALGDNDRAVIVGSPTFGKALVQSLHGLSDGSGIAVTVAHYYTPDGTDISTRGITPDINVSLTAQQQRELETNPALRGTAEDLQFTRAVAAIRPEVLARRQVNAPVLAAPGTKPQLPSQLGRIEP
ncbi:C-terminal processing peptidase subfamily [Synechococcus sp. PCC 7335]|uniref:S41 family peptidase n=1 Tax=Synechococcus sp. (strain ATCC 29403 / PCC 7335) TaxID=91464 RepID=UPI00017EE462|nr:S41 family peptidase [Synechococcus sp. PCC 7335]EDX87033.1 C-terminal processing peptidase subfamily [Synechococcus sp. PCC 7335]